MRRDIERLQDILEAVDRIQKHATKGARPSTETQPHGSTDFTHEPSCRRGAANAVPFVSGPKVFLGLDQEPNGRDVGRHAAVAASAGPAQPCATGQ